MSGRIGAGITSVVLLCASATAGACLSEEAAMPPSQAVPMQADAVFGLWAARVTGGPDRGPPACRLGLGRVAQGEAYGVLVEACTAPGLAGARAWRPVEGGFELLDDAGRRLARFQAEGVDAFRSDDGRFRLERARVA
jgi:hypothetical protein